MIYFFFMLHMYVSYSWVYMQYDSKPPPLWNLMSKNLKGSARNWFIKRAEIAGIPWKKSTEKYSEEYTMNELQSLKYRIENNSIEYPEYYLQPFHGYEEGNLEWKAAIEGEAATYSISANYWKNVSFDNAQKWLRYNVSKNIHNYLRICEIHPKYITHILDIGCSIGISSEYLANSFRHSKIHGIDLSPYFLAIASYRKSQNENNINYVHANAEMIPLKDESINMVCMNFILHEVPYLARMKIFKEIYRILKPDGILAILDLDPDKLRENLDYNPFRKWAFEVTEPHIYNYYQYNMVDSLESSGFDKIAVYKNDPLNRLWVGQKSTLKLRTYTISNPKSMFSYIDEYVYA